MKFFCLFFLIVFVVVNYAKTIPNDLSNRKFPTDPLTECAVLKTVSGGPIRSALYPTPYPAGEEECWLISAPNKTYVQLEFPYFRTVQNDGQLTLYDGPSNQNIVLRQLSGDVYIGTVFSTSNEVLMVFTSIESGTTGAKGFEAYYASFHKP